MFLPAALFTIAAAYALGCIFFRRLALPRVILFGLGAAILSLVVFLLLVIGVASPGVFAGLGSLAIAAAWRLPPVILPEPVTAPLDRASRGLFGFVFLAYTGLYAVFAMAPETQPDAVTYHLGLPSEYLRLGHFPARIGFYEMLPQGIEMLFTFALAFGRQTAAKLVHFAFFLATLPLIVGLGRRLALPDRASFAAAAVYFCTPVAGISGTCAYNDAALVFFSVATLYTLLLWHKFRTAGYAFASGLLAGFCFATKITGLPVACAVIVFLLWLTRGIRMPSLAASGAALAIAPWTLRNLILTGNPFAPLLNRLFPNPYFNARIEHILTGFLQSYGILTWKSAPWQYAFGGGLQGVLGPFLFLLPLAIPSLRKRAGRILLPVALFLLLPAIYNAGTRFLMPALPLFALAVAMVLPRPLLWATVALQAVLCWPPLLERFEDSARWTLRGYPWRAALRLEPEHVYLEKNLSEYRVARMVELKTPPNSKIFSFTSVATTYQTRTLVDFWHSTPDEQLSDALITAFDGTSKIRDTLRFPAQSVRGIRLVATANSSTEWRIHEFRLFTPQAFLAPETSWSLNASPSRWDAAMAFDRNLATFWRSRSPAEPGMFLEVKFPAPRQLVAVEIWSSESNVTFALQKLANDGQWTRIPETVRETIATTPELRRTAMAALYQAGFRYLAVTTFGDGMGQLGRDFLAHPVEWGITEIAEESGIHLLRVF